MRLETSPKRTSLHDPVADICRPQQVEHGPGAINPLAAFVARINDEGRWLDSLPGRVLGDVEGGAYPAIVATIATLIDRVYRALGDSDADPHDGRRVFVELSSDASLAMRRYFAEVGEAAVV